jgi:hypothetical protein
VKLPVPPSVILDTLKLARIAVVRGLGLKALVPSKLTQAFAVLFATLSASVVLVDSFANVIDPSAGVEENVPVVAEVILPFASTVMNGIAVTLP